MTTRPDPRAGEPAPSEPESTDEAEDRAAILRRRAMFVASAIAGLGLAACADPQPCLNIAVPQEPMPDAGGAADAGPADAPSGDPQPCLSVVAPRPPEPDATDGGSPADGGASDAGAPRDDGGSPRPRPCLKVAPPRPCLDMPAPDD